MRWFFVRRVAAKELLTTLRDRRTLVSTILMPLVLMGISGRRAYNGCDNGWIKLCGAPATSASCTLSQSAPTVLSTTAQPCSTALPFPSRGNTSRYVAFHTGTSLM